MSDPIPNYSRDRLHWDFRSGRLFAGGVLQAGSPVSKINTIRAAAASAPTFDGDLQTFAANVTRATDRGLLTERQSTNLMTNSAMLGAVPGEVGNGGELPIGWSVSDGVIPTVEVTGNIGGPAYTTVKILFDNTANIEVATIRLNLEDIGALPVPAGRLICFSGEATVLELSNAFDPQMRAIIRDAAGVLDGPDGARTIAGLDTPTEYQVVPAISPTGASITPVATVRINAGQVGFLRIKIRAVQTEEGGTPTTWIRTTPDLYAGPDIYPFYPFTGAVVGDTSFPGHAGDGGVLPAGLVNSSMSRIQVLATNAEEAGSVTLRCIVFSSPTAQRTGSIRLAPNTQFVAAGGERWKFGVRARVLSATALSDPRMSIAARSSGGLALAGSASADLPPAGRLATTTQTAVMPAMTANVTLSINITADIGVDAVVDLILFRPTVAKLALTTPASGPVTRPQDVNTIPTAPADFALPCTILIDYEHRSLDPVQTGLALQFGSRRVQLLMGDQVGAVVADGGGVIASLTQPANGAHGAMKLAVSITNTSIAVGFPDAAGYGHASADLPALGPCTAAWLGSYGEIYPATGFAREITVTAGAVPAANLAARTRDEWGPRHFRQRVGLSKPPETVAAFSGPITEYTGAAVSTYPILRSARYYRRVHSGAMADVLPNAAAAFAAAAYFLMTVYNASAFPLTMTAEGGLPISLTPDGTETSVVIPPNSHTMYGTDGLRWSYYTKAGPPFQPDEQVPTISIYGPIDEDNNPNRDKIYLPWYVQYHAIIDNVRQFHSYITERMNAYVETGSATDAALCRRAMVDFCSLPGGGYWQGPKNLPDPIARSSLTQLPEAPIALMYALLGIRFSGAVSAEDYRVITACASRMLDDAGTRFLALRDQLLALQAANGFTVTGLQNHSWKFGLACSLVGLATNRHDYLQTGIRQFKLAMQDAAAIPGFIGAMASEIARGSKGATYSMLALSWLLGNSEILIGFGFDAYAYAGGALVKVADFAVRSCDNPEIITAEQIRMVSLGVTGTDALITPSTQDGIGFGNVEDDSTGEFLFAESRVAGGYPAWCRLTDAQVAWLDLWAPRWQLYINSYTTKLGGSQVTLYPALQLIVYALLAAQLRSL